MARNYVPSLRDKVHQEAVYIARYDAAITAFLTVASPEILGTYQAYKAAITALNAVLTELLPPSP